MSEAYKNYKQPVEIPLLKELDIDPKYKFKAFYDPETFTYLLTCSSVRYDGRTIVTYCPSMMPNEFKEIYGFKRNVRHVISVNEVP
jgi:hypothetical protein